MPSLVLSLSHLFLLYVCCAMYQRFQPHFLMLLHCWFPWINHSKYKLSYCIHPPITRLLLGVPCLIYLSLCVCQAAPSFVACGLPSRRQNLSEFTGTFHAFILFSGINICCLQYAFLHLLAWWQVYGALINIKNLRL